MAVANIFQCYFLSADGALEQDCRYFFLAILEKCPLSPKPLGRPHSSLKLKNFGVTQLVAEIRWPKDHPKSKYMVAVPVCPNCCK